VDIWALRGRCFCCFTTISTHPNVLATALGAVIGMGSGFLIDQVRSRRDDT
jgi:hypothetical protein